MKNHDIECGALYKLMDSDQPPLILDIRSRQEFEDAHLHRAVCFETTQDIQTIAADHDQAIITYCFSGQRSATIQRSLQQQGYRRVRNLRGGLRAWQKHNLPYVSAARLNQQQLERYDRHVRMADIGQRGQQRLLESSVLIIGAGGLGSPAALYLAAAGVGRLGIIDDDRIERSNLQRQILHSDQDVGLLKIDSAQQRLNALNPTIQIDVHQERFTTDNATPLVGNYDIVVDGSDNFETRHTLNRACVDLRKPFIYGGVQRFQGQITIFHPPLTGCYNCLYPYVEGARQPTNCSEAGVFGAVPGVIGAMQAGEAIKLITQIGKPLQGRLLLIDMLTHSSTIMSLNRDPACGVCCRPEDRRDSSIISAP